MTDAEIYESNRSDLVNYATVLVGASEAEDIVSTVVVRVLAVRSLTDLDDARAYLFRAVLNESRTRLKRIRTARRRLVGAGPAFPPERDHEILRAVMSLPARQRAATYLFYWADLSVDESARLMGVGSGTVKRYLYLAREKLKGVINES